MIRQCIPADRDKAAAFLQQSLGETGQAIASTFELRLSLIVSEEDQTQGVALFHRKGESTMHELAVMASSEQPQLLGLLVDKALSKLHAQGIHRCRVNLINHSEPQSVWNQSRWAGTQPAAPAAEKPAKKPSKPKNKPAA